MTIEQTTSTQNIVSEAATSQVYKATYSGVPVWEFRVKGVAVMRRKNDDWLNATQILKVADFDKPHRTRILERDVQRGEHEKVQGGYGKYQGTWVPYDKGVDLAERYRVKELLQPLIDFSPSLESPPLAPKHITAASNRPRKPREPKQPKSKPVKPRSSKKGKGKHAEELISLDTELSISNNDIINAPSTTTITASPVISSPNRHYSTSPAYMMDTSAIHYMTESDEHSNNESNSKRKRTNSPDNNTRQTKMSKLSMVETALSTSCCSSASSASSSASTIIATNQYIEMLLVYFTSNSNQIPNFVINPPPDFDANSVIDAQGHTSLHWAAAMANVDMVALLIKAGADIESNNIVGETALMRSAMFPYNYQNRSFREIVQLLGKSIGSVDSREQTVFHHVAIFANSSRIQEDPAKYYFEILITHLNRCPNEQYRKSILNRQNIDGDTAINILAKSKNKQLVTLLFCAGGDLYICNKENKNAEHYLHAMDSHPPTIMINEQRQQQKRDSHTNRHYNHHYQHHNSSLSTINNNNILMRPDTTSFGQLLQSPSITTVTANNKVYTATPTVDSFVPIGKQILEDLCSPYVGELESKNNELSLCNNKLKSLENEIKTINHKVKEMKEIHQKLPEKKEHIKNLINLIKEKIENHKQRRLDNILTEELNKISLTTTTVFSTNFEINERKKEELEKQLDEVIGERKKLMEKLIKMKSSPTESTLPYRQAFNKILKDRIFAE